VRLEKTEGAEPAPIGHPPKEGVKRALGRSKKKGKTAGVTKQIGDHGNPGGWVKRGGNFVSDTKSGHKTKAGVKGKKVGQVGQTPSKTHLGGRASKVKKRNDSGTP